MKIFKQIFLFLFIVNVSFSKGNVNEKINLLQKLNTSNEVENYYENNQIKLNLINELLAEKSSLDDKTIESLYLQKTELIQNDKNELISTLKEYTESYKNYSAQFMLCVETQLLNKFQPVECYQKSSKLLNDYMKEFKKNDNEEYLLMLEFSKILLDYLGKLPLSENTCKLVEKANSFENKKIILLTYFGSLELYKNKGILNEKDLNNLCYSYEYMHDYK